MYNAFGYAFNVHMHNIVGHMKNMSSYARLGEAYFRLS